MTLFTEFDFASTIRFWALCWRDFIRIWMLSERRAASVMLVPLILLTVVLTCIIDCALKMRFWTVKPLRNNLSSSETEFSVFTAVPYLNEEGTTTERHYMKYSCFMSWVYIIHRWHWWVSRGGSEKLCDFRRNDIKDLWLQLLLMQKSNAKNEYLVWIKVIVWLRCDIQC